MNDIYKHPPIIHITFKGICMTSVCPQCGSLAYKRNGYTRHGKQNHRCLDCGRQFSLEPEYVAMTHEKIELIQPVVIENMPIERLC